MKILKTVSFVLFLLTLAIPNYGQENIVVPKRTPNQEAAKQTEKLQQELNLNQDQAKQVFEINLRYARERQISNKRSEALERVKNKDSEIKQVLSPEQNNRLQSKRYERTYLETNTLNRNQPINSGFRSSSNSRTNQTFSVPSSRDINQRNNYRPVNPNFQPRNPSSGRRTNSAPVQDSPSSSRSSFGGLPNAPRRSETTMPPHNNSSDSRYQSTPPNSPGRTQTPVNSSRK